jgi:hypothetical protein
MTLQALLGQRWPDQAALWAGLDTRRTMLNQPIPSEVFQGHAPFQAFREAAHSGRCYRPEWEAELLDLARIFAYLAHCRWFRRIRANGRLDLGAMTPISAPAFATRCSNCTSMPIKAASLGKQQAVRPPSHLHPRV